MVIFTARTYKKHLELLGRCAEESEPPDYSRCREMFLQALASSRTLPFGLRLISSSAWNEANVERMRLLEEQCGPFKPSWSRSYSSNAGWVLFVIVATLISFYPSRELHVAVFIAALATALACMTYLIFRRRK